MSDLLPCPFCGGKAAIDYDGSVYDGTHVYCTECDIRTESYKTKTGSTWDLDAAIAAWNRRALPAAQPDPREAALRDIARQKKSDEMDTEYDVEYAEFEGGYNAIIDVARRALPAVQPDARIKEYEDAYQYALHLAEALRENFPPNPDFRFLGDLVGLLTQIDNMVAGLPQPYAREAALREALAAVNAKWRSGADTPDEVRGLALAEAAILDLIEGQQS